MPYIRKEKREILEPELSALIEKLQKITIFGRTESGVVTYVIYKIIKELYQDGWDVMSDGIKILECAKTEFYRRVLAKHEDKKIQENGDV